MMEMFDKLAAFLDRHDSYLTGAVIGTNIFSLLTYLVSKQYGWALLCLCLIVWFQWAYNKKEVK